MDLYYLSFLFYFFLKRKDSCIFLWHLLAADQTQFGKKWESFDSFLDFQKYFNNS